MTDLDKATQTELEAAAFRVLRDHLAERTDVQNIDMMNLAGFCRNCLSRWYNEAAVERSANKGSMRTLSKKKSTIVCMTILMLKALAVTTAQRASALPDIPTMAETLKGFEVDTWWGLVAPANTPPAMVARLHQAFAAALAAPETKARFGMMMAEPVSSTPDQFAALMKRELTKYEPVVKASGAKVD